MKRNKNKGITLIALVITIIILLILAGISIASLTESGLFEKAKEAKSVNMKAEMRESLQIAINELQIEKVGNGILDDITQEWANNKLKDYEVLVSLTDDNPLNVRKVVIKKSGIIGRFIVDEKLNIIEDDGIYFSYEVVENNGSNIKISITIIEEENGIRRIELPGREPLEYENNPKRIEGLDYTVQLGKEYIITITSGNGKVKKENLYIEPEIQISDIFINTYQNATSSVDKNSVEKGTNLLYVNFTATLDGNACAIEPPLTQPIIRNGTYTYTITGTYNGRIVTKIKEIKVNQYQTATNLVKYDAGEWTKEQIEELQSKKLYDLNSTHIGNNIFKLSDNSGLNFTFGGFTYKGDSTNENKDGVITSRNQSVDPESNAGVANYDGWKIFESEERDGKKYVLKLIHAGSPENFVYYRQGHGDAYRAEYLLSSGQRQVTYNVLLDNETIINPRNWDMYKDIELDKKGYIQDVHILVQDEVWNLEGNEHFEESARKTGSYYWLRNCLWR